MWPNQTTVWRASDGACVASRYDSDLAADDHGVGVLSLEDQRHPLCGVGRAEIIKTFNLTHIHSLSLLHETFFFH